MAPLAPALVRELIDDYEHALARLEQVADVLRRLGPSWRATRDALNELSRLLDE